MKRPTSIVILLTLILLFNMIKIIAAVWFYLSIEAYLEFFLIDFLYGLICFISGVLMFFRKKQGFRIYQITILAMLFIGIIVSKITEISIETSKILLIPVILWSILSIFVKKTKYFEPE